MKLIPAFSIKKIGYIFSISISLLFLHACFEYEETVHFYNKNFSGMIEIKYLVPLNKAKDKSLIKFLSIDKEEVENKLSGYDLNLIEFQKTIVEKDEAKSLFPYKAQVSYKIIFKKFSDLNGILIGTMLTKKKGKTIVVSREFRTISNPLNKQSTQGEKKIHNQILKFLKNGYMKFTILLPQNSECKTTHGQIENGFLSYTLPLSETMERPDVQSWDFSITLP
ncbi:MAG: hypothetical protein KDK90_01845 [Leptospiraceae bacterium]|nr:hypothetical protein [Leptospiraceae bacterium]